MSSQHSINITIISYQNKRVIDHLPYMPQLGRIEENICLNTTRTIQKDYNQWDVTEIHLGWERNEPWFTTFYLFIYFEKITVVKSVYGTSLHMSKFGHHTVSVLRLYIPTQECNLGCSVCLGACFVLLFWRICHVACLPPVPVMSLLLLITCLHPNALHLCPSLPLLVSSSI